MKKIALLLLGVVVAVSPAAAATKKKGKTVTAAAEQKYDSNEASWRLVKDAFPLVLPSWALPIYFNANQDSKKNTKM
jgi:hypothetical protein